MLGFFISKEQADELGLLENPTVASRLQKTIIAITENDVIENQKDAKLEERQSSEMANWFYENYFDSLIDTFTTFQ